VSAWMGHDGMVRRDVTALVAGAQRETRSGLQRFTLIALVSPAADACVTVALAGSLFFSVSPDASRRQILLYLVVTMAPFAVLAPLIGPAIDRFRGGHRWIAAALFVIRAVGAFALAFALYDLAFYFLALAVLVAARASGVVKQALVPGLVDDPANLISANSRLARIATVGGAAGGALAAGLTAIGNSSWPLWAAAALYLAAAMISTTLPRPRAFTGPAGSQDLDEREWEDVHRPIVTMSAAAYTVIRAAVGAFVFGLAFALRRDSEPAWMYGAAIVSYSAGAFAGNVVAPLTRRWLSEERLIMAALVGLAVCAGFGAAGGSRTLILILSTVMGMATTLGRQGFDTLVQRQAPLAMHGRSFARFETQFQLGWVLGAAAATAAAVPTQISLAVVAGILLPSAVVYLYASHQARRFVRSGDTVGRAAAARIEAADEWLSHERPRLAAVEAAAALDMVVAAGTRLDNNGLAERLDALRRRAIEPDGELDPDELLWAIAAVRAAILKTPVR
jgi:hypothetical protein